MTYICDKHHICPHVTDNQPCFYKTPNGITIAPWGYLPCSIIREDVSYKEYDFKEKMKRAIKKDANNNS